MSIVSRLYENFSGRTKKLFFLWLGLILFAFGVVTQCKRQETAFIAEAQIRAWLTASGQLKVRVNIPARSHVYLDRGARGNLIPVSFDWQTLIQDGSLAQNPKLVSAPQGEHDREVQATVLRGQGDFLFTGEKLRALFGKTLRVRTQVCDESKGICYRPVWAPVEIGQE